MNEQKEVVKILESGNLLRLNNGKIKIIMEKRNNVFYGKLYFSEEIGRLEKYECSVEPIEESTFKGEAIKAIDYFYDLAVLVLMKEKEIKKNRKKNRG